MPQKVDALPGGSLGDMEWDEYLNGEVWNWSREEVEEMGVKVESIRAVAHVEGKKRDMIVHTRLNDDGLFIQSAPIAA